jgi:putative restriction endonuclease
MSIAAAGILVARRFPSYRDRPGERYHYPRALYRNAVEALRGAVLLFYEPRRGGRFKESPSGGRMAFVAMAFMDGLEDDPNDPTHGYVRVRYFLEFPTPVPYRRAGISPKALEKAVLSIDMGVAERVIDLGLRVTRSSEDVSDGLVDADDLITTVDRPVVERVESRPVRDAAFRLNVVERAYQGRCALTGVRMTNGRGRAEADAAHIKPVDCGGPDCVGNGIALGKTWHWAFDRGLVSLTDEYDILVVERGLDDRMLALLAPGRRALVPAAPDQRPHTAFLDWHRRHRFKASPSADAQ